MPDWVHFATLNSPLHVTGHCQQDHLTLRLLLPKPTARAQGGGGWAGVGRSQTGSRRGCHRGQLTQNEALIRGPRLKSTLIRLLTKGNMNKVTQVEDKLRRKQKHTSCQRNKGRNGDISHCENQNSYKECKGFCFQILESLPYTHYSWAWKNQSSGTHIGWRAFLLHTQESFLKSKLEIPTHCQNKESLPAKCKHREARRWSQEPQPSSHPREASSNLSYRNLPVYPTLKMQLLTSAPPWPKRTKKTLAGT